jgi:hypothetical protein
MSRYERKKMEIRELDSILSQRRKEDWSRDGDVENNEMRTLPERPQRGPWKFSTK